MFHPDGRTFVAHVDPIEAEGSLGSVGTTLAGCALARFSGALWRRGFEHFDVLGIALRIRDESIADTVALPGDQDPLFATIRSPFTMPFAPFTTDARFHGEPLLGRVTVRHAPGRTREVPTVTADPVPVFAASSRKAPGIDGGI